ncbi:MAG: hypothetical protein AAF587_15400 [Bacteroidota bacterium]
MNSNQHIIETIDRYLEGTLPQEEAVGFREQIEADPKLKEEVEEFLMAKYSVYKSARIEQLKDLSKRFDELGLSKPSSWNNKFGLLSIAALLAIMMAIFLPGRLASPDLYTKFHITPDAREVRGESNLQALLMAHIEYNQKEYLTAIQSYENILQLPDFEHQEEARFFLAMAHLELGQSQSAIEHLQLIQQGEFAEMADWYQALAWIKVEKPESAKDILQTIRKRSSHFYFKQAGELLKELPKKE